MSTDSSTPQSSDPNFSHELRRLVEQAFRGKFSAVRYMQEKEYQHCEARRTLEDQFSVTREAVDELKAPILCAQLEELHQNDRKAILDIRISGAKKDKDEFEAAVEHVREKNWKMFNRMHIKKYQKKQENLEGQLSADEHEYKELVDRIDETKRQLNEENLDGRLQLLAAEREHEAVAERMREMTHQQAIEMKRLQNQVNRV
ncbi:hypothetical protein DFH11DRAFT_1600151 [Phellopilus nigrolimitatus]|nr:hypothetical protein DFH11DRAFT_1600151 [Phellopilus nigrolimitatus]